MSNVKIPDGAVRCSVYEAFRTMREDGKTIVAVLQDEDNNNYAAHCFYPWQLKHEQEYKCSFSELSEYIEKGKWYAIPLEGADVSNPIYDGDFINVYLAGGIVDHVSKFETKEEAMKHLREHYSEEPFDPEIDDATIWKREPDGSYEIIHNEDTVETA
ncbi:hypothetical protein TCA2_4408 [Paenibacillus sp. TCA20]|uniref:hypothetical protein n=1 Tax=Paenibacillus sp. TCA20 TaxID=1499968 RepID=UPI0004D7D4CD|nr:hypothetical protein [Paenibacillus sp. TCA20]GAK41916.1 hypothetical protein TCA2_4408 [Paenibacillus sp. TCA20]